MEAALRLVADRRYDDVRIEEVAAQAGLSVGAVYHHFEGKDDLFGSAARHYYDLMDEEVHARIATVTDPGERLRGVLQLILRDPPDGWLAIRRPVLAQLTATPALEGALGDVAETFSQRGLGSEIRAAIEAGAIPIAAGIDVDLVVELVNGCFLGLMRVGTAVDRRGGGGFSSTERFDAFFRIFLGGLARPLDPLPEPS